MRRFLGFFAVTIDNPNTRAAYFYACRRFCAWCDRREDIDERRAMSACPRPSRRKCAKKSTRRHTRAIRWSRQMRIR
jgi:hypothetical protein